jgi:hypothetical protein
MRKVMVTISRSVPYLCIPRMSQPKGMSRVMCSTERYAPVGVGMYQTMRMTPETIRMIQESQTRLPTM